MTYIFKIDKFIFVILLCHISFLPLYGQRYDMLLKESQKDSILKVTKNNNGLSFFSFSIDTNVEINFLYFSSILINEGLSINKRKEGIYYYYRYNKLDKVISYLNDCEHGYTYEYYSTGLLKCFGYMICANSDTLYVKTTKNIDPLTFEEITSITQNTSYSVKDGYWFYYDRTGKMTFWELWQKGKQIR